jgi:serine protease Do
MNKNMYKTQISLFIDNKYVYLHFKNLVYLLLLVVMFSPNRVIAAEFNPKSLYKKVSDSIVAIKGFDSKSRKRSFGAGSIIDKNGLVLTNAHIILNKRNKKPFKNIYIILKPKIVSGNYKNDTSKVFRSRLLHYSRKLDLALLKITSESESLPIPLKFADSSIVSIGDRVLAIGHPENGGLWSLTTGTIGSKINNYRNIPGKNVFQTEASLNRGNSGGPLIDENGFLIGVNSMFSRLSSDGLPVVGINFSIMSNVAAKWIRSLKANKVLNEDSNVKRHSLIREASIIPVPETIDKKTVSDSHLNLDNKIKSVKKINSREKGSFRLIEGDMEKMIRMMQNKIKDKRKTTKIN